MATRLKSIEALFKALADATRLRILALLVGGEICVCEIHDSLKLPQPTVSRHLAYLRRVGLVETRRDGLWIYYRLARLDDAVLRTLTDIVTHVLGHVDAIVRDAQRLHVQTGQTVGTGQSGKTDGDACCIAPSESRPVLACCERAGA